MTPVLAGQCASTMRLYLFKDGILGHLEVIRKRRKVGVAFSVSSAGKIDLIWSKIDLNQITFVPLLSFFHCSWIHAPWWCKENCGPHLYFSMPVPSSTVFAFAVCLSLTPTGSVGCWVTSTSWVSGVLMAENQNLNKRKQMKKRERKRKKRKKITYYKE